MPVNRQMNGRRSPLDGLHTLMQGKKEGISGLFNEKVMGRSRALEESQPYFRGFHDKGEEVVHFLIEGLLGLIAMGDEEIVGAGPNLGEEVLPDSGSRVHLSHLTLIAVIGRHLAAGFHADHAVRKVVELLWGHRLKQGEKGW